MYAIYAFKISEIKKQEDIYQYINIKNKWINKLKHSLKKDLFYHMKIIYIKYTEYMKIKIQNYFNNFFLEIIT